MATFHRPSRRPGEVTAATDPEGSRLLAQPHHAWPPNTSGWDLNTRIWQLRLNHQMVESDLADLNMRVPQTRLRRVLAGVEAPHLTLLAALIHVLQLQDRSLTHEQVLTATTKPWTSLGQRVPPPVINLLARTRNLTTQQIHNLTSGHGRPV
jgi:hypothetical protein